MAVKEFKMKLTVDTEGAVKQIDGTITAVADFEKQISSLQNKLSTTKIGTDEYKKLQKELERTEQGLQTAKNSQKGWLDTLSETPGVLGTFGQSIKGVGQVFGNLNMAFKTSVIGIFATILAKLIQKFSEMEGVLDPLDRIFSIFSGTVGRLAEILIGPVAAAIELVADGLEGLVNFFSSDDIGTALSDIAKGTDELTDSQASFELQQEKSNRQLQEAREIAADSTKTIAERKKALEDAGNLERKIAQEGRERELARARLQAQQLAVDLGFNKKRIEEISKYDSKQLESFQKEINGFKALNREKSNELLKLLGNIEQSAADEAKIGRRVEAGKQQLDNEAAQRAKEAADKAKQRRKDDLDARIELEKNAANTNEQTLRKLLEEKDKLENEGTNKSKAQLELQKQNRDKAIKDALKADKDAQKEITDNLIKQENDRIKIMKEANDQKIKGQEASLNLIKALYGEDSKQYKEAQMKINADRQKALEDELKAINSKKELTEEDKKRINEIKNESINLLATVITNNQKEIESEKQKNAQKLTDKMKNDEAELEYLMSKAEGDFELQRTILSQQEELDRQQYEKDIAAAGNNAEKKREIEINYTKTKDENAKARESINQKEYEQQMAIAQGVANALGSLSQIIGKDTLAGKALGIAQALINTYVGASEAIKQKSTLPSPFDVITKVVNVATIIATGLKTVKEITAVQVPSSNIGDTTIKKERGGLLRGPLHQQGGIMTPFGELEGGEYVINRTSTNMFRPTLDRINSLGGGQVDLTPSILSGNVNQPIQQPIFKTYVVASEMSSQQELNRIIRDRSKI